jgi:CubicO group peptidase (beta-lactamase class C family)
LSGVLIVAGLLSVAACRGDATDSTATTTTATTETSVATVETTPVTTTTTEPEAVQTTRPVPTTTTTTTTSPTTTTEPEPELSAYDFAAVSQVARQFVDERGLNGAGLVIVHRDSGVIYEDYWGEFDRDRISLVASSSKMITAGVLLRLQDDSLLDVDAPVADVVDWGEGNPEITPAQLISNSSGLVGLLPNPGYGPYVCQFIASGSLQDCAASIFTTTADDADIAAPDTEFRYGGAQWQVAGAVAEAASGKSWAQLVDEIYVKPCGLETLGYNNHFTQIGTRGFDYPLPFDSDPSTLKPTDNPNLEGGAYITTGDYAKLLLMHLRGGMCGDNQVLSQAALDRLHDDRIDDAYDGSAGPDTGYAMGWWVDRKGGRIRDPGAYGAVPWLDLEDGYGAYLVMEADAGTGLELAGQLYDLVETAVMSQRTV